jgi:serine/threonine protein kinase
MTEHDKPRSTALVPVEDLPPVDPVRLLRGRYQLVAEIGRGGLSRVFKARDMVAVRAELADPYVALKLIAAGKNTDRDVIALMHREARRLRDLVHPNIIRVYDMDADRRLHFMIMEYLEGQSLSRMLRDAPEHRLALPAVDRLVVKIAAALEFAHGNGIIHADLKPGNVFLETSGRIKLIDFNIAYPVARPRKTREEDTVAILGRLGALTPAYASPQRLAGAEPGTGDDVFSLGIITYLALTGTRPYGPGNALAAAETGQVPTRPYGLSASRWRALRRAISLDDGGRTASAAEFARDFAGGPLAAISDWWSQMDRGRLADHGRLGESQPDR